MESNGKHFCFNDFVCPYVLSFLRWLSVIVVHSWPLTFSRLRDSMLLLMFDFAILER